MPELPEVETIRLKLIPLIVNKTIKNIEILVPKQFIGKKEDAIGKKIIDIKRTGKVFNIILNDDIILNIHLKMTGQLLYSDNINNSQFENIIPFTNSTKMPNKTTRIIVKFTDNSVLYFNDLRKFGWFKLSKVQEGPRAIDVLSSYFTLDYLQNVLSKSKKPVKSILMDQDKLSGLGNIYTNDALFVAKINPTRKSNTITRQEINKLYDAILFVIKQGIKDQGSSGADEAFILPDGKKGTHQRHFLVYQKEDKKCIICNTIIKRIKQGGRSSFICSKCQK